MKQLILILVVVQAICWATCTIAQVPADGLVAYYLFNGNANDASGNGRNGVITGATLAQDRFGKADAAFSFDGNDYIEIPGTSALHLQSGFTLAAWVNFSQDNADQAIVAKHVWGDNNGILIGVGHVSLPADNRLHVYVSGPRLLSPGTYNDGQWHFVCGTFDGSTMRLYVDGQLSGSQSVAYSATNTANFRIGASSSLNSAFIGTIDDVGIYDRPLTETEVNILYSGNGEPTDVIPPGQITLTATKGSANDVILSWTAPGDDGWGGDNATQYDIRYSLFPINALTWYQATQLLGEPAPSTPNTPQSWTIATVPGFTYCYAMKTVDDAGNWSEMSNVASITLYKNDLTIDHIEVNQCIQNDNNTIPLVAGKPTVVRVYVKSDLSYDGATVRLKMDDVVQGQDIPLFKCMPLPLYSSVQIAEGRNSANFYFDGAIGSLPLITDQTQQTHSFQATVLWGGNAIHTSQPLSRAFTRTRPIAFGAFECNIRGTSPNLAFLDLWQKNATSIEFDCPIPFYSCN